MNQHLRRSSHLKFSLDRRYAYHALFGNLCAIDAELGRFLHGLRETLSDSALEDAVGSEVANELFRNYFIVREAEEERKLVHAWLEERKRLLPSGYYLEALQVSSSNLCNFACSYCFADSSDRRSSLRQHISTKQPTLAFETAVRAIDALLKNARVHKRRHVGVKFLGREPLINWRTIERVLTHYREFPIQWAITTNGSLISKPIAQELKTHNVAVVVSIDGPAPTNNALRILKTEGSAYDLSERGVKMLGAEGVPFGISSVISRVTDFETFVSFMGKMAQLGARELELTLVMQTDTLEAQKHPCGDDALVDFLIEVYREGRRLGLLIHGDWIDPFHRILSTHKYREERELVREMPAGCSATSHQISLESSGDLFPCRAMSLHYGHIDDLSAAVASEAYRKVGMRTFLNVPFCHGCNLEGFCQGTCLGSCEENSGDIYQPQQQYCDLYRRATNKLFETFMEECKDGNQKRVA